MTCAGTRDPSPGEALTCRGTRVVGEGQHWNEIESVARNSDGSRIVGKDPVHFVGIATPT